MLLDAHLGLVSLADFRRAAPHKQVLMLPAVDNTALLASPSELSRYGRDHLHYLRPEGHRPLWKNMVSYLARAT